MELLEHLKIISCCFANLNLRFEKQVFFSSLKAANDFKVLMLASNLSETDFTLKVRLILTSFTKNVFELLEKSVIGPGPQLQIISIGKKAFEEILSFSCLRRFTNCASLLVNFPCGRETVDF